MGEAYIEIEEENFKNLSFNNKKICFLLNLFLIILAIYNINLYVISINAFGISILLIFGHNAMYLKNSNQENFIRILQISSIILIFAQVYSFCNIFIYQRTAILLTFSIVNISKILYLFKIAKNSLYKYKIIYAYIMVVFLHIILNMRFSSNEIYITRIIIDIIISVINLLIIYKLYNKEKYYKIMINLGNYIIISQIAYLFYKIFNYKIFFIITLLLLFNYVYYGYRCTIKYNLIYPFIELDKNNKVLDINSKKIDFDNLSIKSKILVQNKLKNCINKKNELLKTTFLFMPSLTMVTDENFNIIHKNNQFRQVFNEKVTNFSEVFGNNYNEKLLKNLYREINNNNSLDEIIYLNDKIYMLNVTKSSYKEKTGYLISLINITKEKKMEEELISLNEEYKKIVYNIPCTIMMKTTGKTNYEDKITRVNKKFEEKFGYTEDELKNISMAEFIEKVKVQEFDTREYKIINRSTKENIDKLNYCEDGDFVKNYLVLNNNKNYKIVEVNIKDYIVEKELFKLLNIKNVTEEMIIRKKRNDQKIIYKKVLDAIPEAILVEDIKTNRVLYTNKELKLLLGINEDKRDLIVQKYRNNIIKEYIHNIYLGCEDKIINIENENKENKEIRIISKKMIFGEREAKLRLIKDIKEEKEAEKIKRDLIRQREYDNLKMAFFTNMSHEIKTPLNNIYSSTQLIESLYKKNKIKDVNDIVNKHIKITKQNMFRLLRLIENIINISQVKSDLYKFNATNFDIVYITEKIVTSILAYAESKNIKLTFEANQESLIVGLDPEAMERVILNILSNAIKFTPKNGQIEVQVNKKNNMVEISIKDSGVGIEKEKLNSICERFQQIENSNISNEFGSGIGLYLTKSLVELQKGDMYIDSKIGEGTKVTVLFPIKEVVETINIKNNYNNNIEKFEIEFFDIYK